MRWLVGIWLKFRLCTQPALKVDKFSFNVIVEAYRISKTKSLSALPCPKSGFDVPNGRITNGGKEIPVNDEISVSKNDNLP